MSDKAQNNETNVVIETAMTIPKHIPWLWFMNGVGGSMCTFMNTYIMFFMTEYAGISPAQMSAMLSFARILDLLVSLFAGAFVQKGSKYRIYILLCPIVSSLGGCLAFLNPNIPIGIKLVTIAIGYCGIHFPMNFLTVARNSTIMLIAGPNPTNLMAMTSKATQSMQFARIICTAATLPLIQIFLDLGMSGYFIIQFAYSIVGIATAFSVYRVTKPYEDANTANIQKARESGGKAASDVSFLDMYKTAMKEKAVWGLILGDSIRSFGTQAVAACATYYYRYSLQNVLLTSVQGTVNQIVAMVAAIVLPTFAKKLTKRNASLLTQAICFVMYVAMIFTADGNATAYLLISCVATSALLIQMIHGANFYLDIAEIQLYESGKDLRPFYMSLQNLSPKLSFLSSGPVLAWVLNKSQYDVNAAQVIPNTQTFVFNWGLITAVFYGVAFVCYFLLYNVDEKKAQEIAVLNAEKARADREAQGN